MQALTLLVASSASILVLCLSPIYGLVIYVATFSWYPTYLTVPIGTIDFTLRRIVVLSILFKLFVLTDLPKRFEFVLLDKCVIVYFIAQFLAGTMNSSPLMQFLENHGGAVLDTMLPYFVVRIILQNRQQYFTLLKWILIIGAPLAIIGLYECSTGINLMGFFRKYNTWIGHSSIPLEERSWVRYGLHRSTVVFSHPIMFGLYFAFFCPICVGLMRNIKRYKGLYIIGLILMAIGVFSSMSSGAWVALLFAGLFTAFYHWRKYWKPVVIIIVIMCGLVEVISNRHFYDVLSDLSFNTANAWYRSRLIDVALFEGGMSGHWLAGFPFGFDPGWGEMVNLNASYAHDFTDMVNQYLKILCMYGLVGFVPFVAMNMAAVKGLINSYKECPHRSDRWLIWCLFASLFGAAAAFITVSIYGPPVTVYYIMLAFCGAMPSLIKKNTLCGGRVGRKVKRARVRSFPSQSRA